MRETTGLAQTMKRRLNRRKRRGDLSGARTDDELIALWWARYGDPEDPTRVTQTQHSYRNDVSIFLSAAAEVNAPGLRDMTVEDVADVFERMKTMIHDKKARLIKGKRASSATMTRRIATLKSLFSFGAQIGYLDANVMAAVRAPKQESNLAERILTEKQVREIIGAAPEGVDRTLLKFLYYSGARVNEATILRWRHVIQRETGIVQITIHGKGRKVRSVLLPEHFTVEFLSLQRGPDEPVFQRFDRRLRKLAPMSRKHMHDVVSQAARAVGLKGVSPHWMRHAFASHAFSRGAKLHVVQASLGHSSASTTGRYLHARPTESAGLFLPDVESG